MRPLALLLLLLAACGARPRRVLRHAGARSHPTIDRDHMNLKTIASFRVY